MKITAFVWVCACACGHASVGSRRRECGVCTPWCIRAFSKFVFGIFRQAAFEGRAAFIILLVLRAFVNTRPLWPLSLTCAEAPKPHVNLDNGGLGDSGNCCLSVQWKERLSCNGSPVGSVCKLLCTAAVWGVPTERHISVLFWLAAWFGWYQFMWRWSLLLSRWVSAFIACTGLNVAARSPKENKFTFHCFVSDVKLFLRLYSASAAVTF